jgi:hypothetical protein
MIIQHRTLLYALAITLAVPAAGYAGASGEPSHRGKQLSVWLEEFYPEKPSSTPEDRARAKEAVRAIGKEAIPTLLRMIENKDPSLKLEDTMNTPANSFQWRGLLGFRALGAEGRDAFPDLVRFFHDPDLAEWAFPAMVAVGGDAAPVFRDGLTNQNEKVRLASLWGLQEMRSNAWVAVPDIMKRLHDPSSTVQRLAGLVLEGFRYARAGALAAQFKCNPLDLTNWEHPQPHILHPSEPRREAAIPALLAIVSSTNVVDILLRSEATNALAKIAPSALKDLRPK